MNSGARGRRIRWIISSSISGHTAGARFTVSRRGELTHRQRCDREGIKRQSVKREVMTLSGYKGFDGTEPQKINVTPHIARNCPSFGNRLSYDPSSWLYCELAHSKVH